MKTFRFVLLLFLVLSISNTAWAQNQTVKGRVMDSKLKEPLMGVSILEIGTSNGTVTDLDGNFTLSVPKGVVLRISYVGYLVQEVPINGKTYLDIFLKEDTELLDEVVIVGYGAQKKATLSGSVTSVGGEKLAKTPVTNVSQGLAGRLPGVVAVSNTSEPGYDGATITVRGVNTFGKADPLVVVDGVPGRSLERIDPSTIETMSVLKDASAAIYGAQAANGVILITTKRGKAGKPRVGLDTRQGPIEDWNGSYTGYYMRKFLDPSVNHQYDKQPYPWRQIRYAEVLLNYAEACIELGEDAEARKYINMIRTRAGMPDIPDSEMGDVLKEHYRNERKIELAYEQHRYFDIRRWMIAPEVIKNVQGIDIRYPYGVTEPNYSIIDVQERKWNDKSYLLPIYLDEMQKNDLLIQNPLY